MMGSLNITGPVIDATSLPAIAPALGDDRSEFAQLLPSMPLPAVDPAMARPDAGAMSLMPTGSTDDDRESSSDGDAQGVAQTMECPFSAAYPSITLPWPNSPLITEEVRPTGATGPARPALTLAGAVTTAVDADGAGQSAPPAEVDCDMPDRIAGPVLLEVQSPVRDGVRINAAGRDYHAEVLPDRTQSNALQMTQALNTAEQDHEPRADALPGIETGLDSIMDHDAVPALSGRGWDSSKPNMTGIEAHTPVNHTALIDSRAAETLRAAAYLDDLANEILATRTLQTGTSFRLATEVLGQVEIAIDRSADGMSVQMTARGDDASVAVSAAQPRLHDELRAQGVRVSDHADQLLDRQSSGGRDHGAHRHSMCSGGITSDIDPQPVASDRPTLHRFA